MLLSFLHNFETVVSCYVEQAKEVTPTLRRPTAHATAASDVLKKLTSVSFIAGLVIYLDFSNSITTLSAALQDVHTFSWEKLDSCNVFEIFLCKSYYKVFYNV